MGGEEEGDLRCGQPLMCGQLGVKAPALPDPLQAVLDLDPRPGDRHRDDGFGQPVREELRAGRLGHPDELANGGLRDLGFAGGQSCRGHDQWFGGTWFDPSSNFGRGPIRCPEQNTRHGQRSHERAGGPVPIRQVGGESEAGRAVAVIEIPVGSGSPRLPRKTRPVAIKTPPRGSAQQRVTSPRAVRVQFQEALCLVHPGHSPGHVLTHDGAAQSGRNLGTDAGANDHLAAGGRQLVQHLVPRSRRRAPRRVLEHVGGAGGSASSRPQDRHRMPSPRFGDTRSRSSPGPPALRIARGAPPPRPRPGAAHPDRPGRADRQPAVEQDRAPASPCR